MELLLALTALSLQSFFAGSETALVRANWIRITHWAGENRFGAKSATELLSQKEAFLVTTLVGANVFVIAFSSILEQFFLVAAGPKGTLISSFLASVICLLFGQYLPKTVAQTFPERWLCAAAHLLRLANQVFRPLSRLLIRIAGVQPGEQAAQPISRREVIFALRESISADGSLAGTAAKSAIHTRTDSLLRGMVARFVNFPELTISEAITPMSRVVAVAEGTPEEELRTAVSKHPFTRIPVYQGSRDNIVGVIHVRDWLLSARLTVRPPFFVPLSMRVITLMNQMMVRGEHLAIVRDDQGATLGIVTLEDLLEELVGEIRSEE